MTREKQSPNEQTTSGNQTGSGDEIIDMLRRHDIPVTREHYLNFAYMGEVPEELSAEEEANLPPMLRADEERRMISKRTREALAAAKRRGVKLGGIHPQDS